MESNIKSVTKEMKDYYVQITKADNDNSLTTIQKKEFQEKIKKQFEQKGIKYFISVSDDGTQYSRICYQSPPWFINDIGTIDDVSEKGAFPIRIKIGNNISINYEPRNLKDTSYLANHDRINSEFLHLKKGNDYQFKGQISYCDYYYAKKPEEFHFTIIGKDANDSHCFIATACYGNYDTPEVLVLRQFRDTRLLTNSFGKLFVATYYLASPFFATVISKSDKLKNFVRQYFLHPLVTRLQRKNKTTNR